MKLQLFIITCGEVCFLNSSIRMEQLYIQIIANGTMWYLSQVLMFCRTVATEILMACVIAHPLYHTEVHKLIGISTSGEEVTVVADYMTNVPMTVTSLALLLIATFLHIYVIIMYCLNQQSPMQ